MYAIEKVIKQQGYRGETTGKAPPPPRFGGVAAVYEDTPVMVSIGVFSKL
jgi:hypothetical protein